MGAQSGMAYYTGFMIEKSLSMDHVFVIALIVGGVLVSLWKTRGQPVTAEKT